DCAGDSISDIADDIGGDEGELSVVVRERHRWHGVRLAGGAGDGCSVAKPLDPGGGIARNSSSEHGRRPFKGNDVGRLAQNESRGVGGDDPADRVDSGGLGGWRFVKQNAGERLVGRTKKRREINGGLIKARVIRSAFGRARG